MLICRSRVSVGGNETCEILANTALHGISTEQTIPVPSVRGNRERNCDLQANPGQ